MEITSESMVGQRLWTDPEPSRRELTAEMVAQDSRDVNTQQS